MASTGDNIRNPAFHTYGGAPTFAADLTEIADTTATMIGEAVATVSALPAADNWVGRHVRVDADNSERVWTGTAWVIVGGALLVGVFGADGNGAVSSATLVRDPFGWVDLVALTTRTNSTTYATNLILGVLPVGFRPAQDTPVPVLTYGSGSLNHAIVASTGTVTLVAASPAGHTAARITARFQGA